MGLGDVTVVIVTYESADFIADALRSLPDDDLGGVIIVDNASTDRSVDAVRAEGGAAQLITLDRNVGFGAGCNVGLAAATTPLVLFLNPDAVISGDDLRRLVAHLDAHPDVALVAPRVYRSGEPLTSGGSSSTLRSSLRFLLPPWLGRFLHDNRFAPSYDRTGPAAYVEGACMLARREVLEAIGRFDERYFLFFEEQDLSRRLAAAGYETHLVADASAEHRVGAARASVPFAARPAYVASNRLYLERWHGALAARAFGVVVAASWWVRGALGRVDRANARAIVSAALGRSRP